MTNNISNTTAIENIHPLFEFKGMEEMYVPEQDKLLSMSPEAQIILMKLGIAWQETTGFQSWVDNEVLISLLKIPDDTWTINRLSKWSGYGRSGIEYSLIPFMKKVGIITENITGRFNKYSVTVHGREVLETITYSCLTCHNERKCIHCETGAATIDRWGDNVTPCDHTLTSECDKCDKTGIEDCNRCDGTGLYTDWSNENIIDCYGCIGTQYPKGKTKCHNCCSKCKWCIDNTRVKACGWCEGNMKCRNCKTNINSLINNESD